MRKLTTSFTTVDHYKAWQAQDAMYRRERFRYDNAWWYVTGITYPPHASYTLRFIIELEHCE